MRLASLGAAPGRVQRNLYQPKAVWRNVAAGKPLTSLRIPFPPPALANLKLRTLFHQTFTQFVEDDKGLVAILIFSELESTAMSASRCVLMISSKLSALSISCNIGLTTGKVFYGPVGDRRRCEMAWIGDSINLSARLMSLAEADSTGSSDSPPNIYSDKSTNDLASSDLNFEAKGTVQLKGKTGKTDYFVLKGLKSRGSILVIAKESGEGKDSFLSPSAIYDNFASVHSAMLLDYALMYARFQIAEEKEAEYTSAHSSLSLEHNR